MISVKQRAFGTICLLLSMTFSFKANQFNLLMFCPHLVLESIFYGSIIHSYVNDMSIENKPLDFSAFGSQTLNESKFEDQEGERNHSCHCTDDSKYDWEIDGHKVWVNFSNTDTEQIEIKINF